MAIAALDDAFDGDPPEAALARFAGIEREVALETARRLNRIDDLVTQSHGVGRWFDAKAALGLGRTHVKFEGHATLIAAGVAVTRAALQEWPGLPLVLTGGCFQNGILTEGLLAALGGPTAVYPSRQVPPNDGGIALGQTVVANAVS